MVPTDLLRSILTKLKDLRAENKQTKALLATLLSTKPIVERGAFESFPKLPIELRHAIWDIALNVLRVVGTKIIVGNSGDDTEALVPTSPNSPLLLVSQESRSQAKRALFKCTKQEVRSRDRVPMLYLNPHVDTLWAVNFTWRRARNARISETLFTPIKIWKLAVPAYFYIDMMNLSSEVEDKIIELVVRFHKKEIKEVMLGVGDLQAAEAEDAVFVEPKESPANYMDDEWCGGVEVNYPPALPRPGDGILPWSSCNKWATAVLDLVIDGYMAKNHLSKHTRLVFRNPTETENILVKLAKKAWELPTIKFLESTTRTELCKLNAPF